MPGTRVAVRRRRFGRRRHPHVIKGAWVEGSDLIQLPATAPPTINDSDGRLYRGISPFLMPQDRIENVTIEQPGRYLVICLVRPHFVNDKMHGYVNVVP